MINQLIVGCGPRVMAEASCLAESAGIDAKRIPNALPAVMPTARCCRRLYPRMVGARFQAAGYARQLLKDLEMVMEFFRRAESADPMTGGARLYRILVHRGIPNSIRPRCSKSTKGEMLER
jgi:3-hydroxyisobutyrate dehydrogenase